MRREPGSTSGALRGKAGGWPLRAYFALLIALVIAAAAAGAIYVAIQSHRDARGAARSEASFSASTAAMRIDDAISAARGTVTGVAGTLRGRALPKQLSNDCSLTFGGSDALPTGHVDIVLANGTVVCTSRSHTGASVPGYPGASWLQAALKKPVFIAPQRDAATGRLAVLFAAPIGGAVVAGFANLTPIAASLDRLYDGGHPAEFVIASNDGKTVISRSIDPARWTGAKLSTPLSTGDLSDVAGVPRIYAEADAPAAGWKVYVGERRSAALAADNSLRNRELLIVLCGLVAVMLATFVIYRRVAVPIRSLARTIGTHDWRRAPVQTSGPAEVAQLGAEINSLVATIDRESQERHEIEQQLRHAQKMDALGRVVAGVSHDFNNLLTAIGGFTSLILRSTSAGDEIREHATHVAQAADRAQTLARQLLVFSRDETPTRTAVDANDVLRQLTPILERLLGPRIVLRTDLSPDVVVVEGDRGQLEQVLLNLTVNARDAMPDGGDLVVRSALRSLDAENARRYALPPGDYVLVEVRDSGAGIAPEIRDRLFEPFFTTKPSGQGTGLGLATSYGIVANLGGTIDVESTVGEGSMFTIVLPAATQLAVEGPLEPGPTEATGGDERVLVVEDDPGLRELTRIVLEDAGYDVLEASAAEEALELAGAGGPIDVLLTDGVMGAMSGRELARRFLGDPHGTAVVYMSGYPPEVADPAEGLFLAKPFTPEALLAAVREALDGRRR
jgi:signal transduction histidine kinase